MNTLLSFKHHKKSFALIILLVVAFFSSFPWSFYGMNWRDSALYFHLGNRLLHNDFPYRDYVFQVGFIPIIFDAFFQNILGQSYYASLFAAFIVKTTNLLVYYFIFRQFSSQVISVALCSGFALMNSSLVHWSTSYVYLFLSISALFIILGLNKLEKGSSTLSFLYIAISGFSLALVIAARQSNGTLCILVTLGVILIYSLRNPKKYLRTLTTPFITGLLLGLGALVLFLVLNQALIPAFQQLFLDASEKKKVGGFAALIDVFLGGIKFDSSIKEVVKVVIIPILLSAIVFRLIQYPTKANSKYNVNLIGILLLPSLLLIGISISLIGHLINTHNLPTIIASTALLFTYDLPSTFFSFALLGSCIFPKFSQKLLGVPEPIFPLLIALTLGSTWAMQMSWPGRAYLDSVMLMPLTIITILMPSKVPTYWKKSFCLLFLGITVIIFTVSQIGGFSNKGLYGDVRYSLDSPMTKFIQVPKDKAVAFSMLRQNIKPGESCFIYGSAPVLYTLLQCKNPTLVDTTYSDFYTLNDIKKAIASLRENPPEWIISTVGARPIDDTFDGSPDFYGVFNQAAPKELHGFIKEFIKDYQLVSTVRDLFPNGKDLKSKDLDDILDLRLYRYTK
ncbi:hypothetical protein [Chroococcidiopsis sp. CCNUC1]|uniref:hypothetical protein n=1 Tax=Chroococcidiopsis sp. CCNUC1 TaxID=2653189 RepID=UPI002021545A|nr:hypothetical protein [Chroococcidiopsis sp. CCNUC1]URD49431.1 hypothetical protein M5J74_24310 [Chroococcidiopsis sp. CCNUC1]